MELIKKDEVIKLSDGNEYIVVDVISYNNTNYLYLASKDLKLMVGKEVIENNKVIIETVTDSNEIKRILELFLGKQKEE